MRRKKQRYHVSLYGVGLLMVYQWFGGAFPLRAEVGQSGISALTRPSGARLLTQRSTPADGIIVQDNLVSVNVQNQELPAVIASLAQQGNIDVQNLDEVPQTRISLRFENLSLVEGLKRILRTVDLSGYVLVMAERDGQSRVQRLLFLGGAPGSSGSRVVARSEPSGRLQPPRPSQEDRGEEVRGDTSVFDDIKQNATMRRLLSQLLHTNDQVRERALERLIRMIDDDTKQAELLDMLEPLLEDLASEDRDSQEQARSEIRDLLRR